MSNFVLSILKYNLRQNLPVRKSRERNDFSRRFLPYLIEMTGTGRLMVLNREYKPLGLDYDFQVDYDSDEYLYSTVERGDIAKRVSDIITKDRCVYYFYTDKNSPRHSPDSARDYIDHVMFVFGPLISKNSKTTSEAK